MRPTSLLWALTTVGFANSLRARSVQSSAVCLSQFNWASNRGGQSPCIVAGYLLAQCAGGNWNVPAIGNSSNHYTPPTAANANRCVCSWAAYNLLQACAFCQGDNFESAIFGWNGWKTNCSDSFLSAPNPFPLEVQIPGATSIPFYALTNPDDWENAIFDPTTAQQLQSEGKPDQTEQSRQPPSTSSGTNVGAIAGGVAGAVAVLTIIGISVFVYCRKHRERLHRGQTMYSAHTHAPSLFSRWPSYMRTRSEATISDGSRAMLTSPVPGIVDSLSASDRNTYASPSYTGSLTSVPGSLSVRSPDSSQLPTIGHGPTVHFQSMHAHTLSTGSSASAGSQPSYIGAHGRSASQTSDDSAIHPYSLPPLSAVPEGRNMSDEDLEIYNQSHGVSVTPSGVVVSQPTYKERRNPPAYTPVSSPEERYFASMASDSMRAQVEASNMETASATMIDFTQNTSGMDRSERGEYPVDRKRR